MDIFFATIVANVKILLDIADLKFMQWCSKSVVENIFATMMNFKSFIQLIKIFNVKYFSLATIMKYKNAFKKWIMKQNLVLLLKCVNNRLNYK